MGRRQCYYWALLATLRSGFCSLLSKRGAPVRVHAPGIVYTGAWGHAPWLRFGDFVTLIMHPSLSRHRKSYMEQAEVYFWTATINGWQHLLAGDKYKIR